MDEAEFVWIRMSLVAAPDHRLHCSYTVISQAPLSREQQTELYDVVYAIARSTAEAMPREADDDEAPLPFTATILEPQADAVFSGAANAMLTAALPAASVFGTLADGTETIESEARTAAIGALGLLISNSGPDAEPAELLCQAMVFPTIELPWDETLNRISSGLRIAGMIFALATGNPAMLASCAGGLAHTAVTKIMGALVRSILRSMFGPSEEVIDLTRPALSAESRRQEPPTPAALPDRTVIEIPETPTPAKPPAERKSSRILAKRESGDRPRRSAEPRQANEPLIPAQPTDPQPKCNFNQPDFLYPTLPEPSFSPPSPPERTAVARPAPGLGRANVA